MPRFLCLALKFGIGGKFVIEHEMFLMQRAELEKTHRKAPWTDFANHSVFEGDIIEHPSGERGTVIFTEEKNERVDQWLVKYENDEKLSRLCLQLGCKGQAIVVGHIV